MVLQVVFVIAGAVLGAIASLLIEKYRRGEIGVRGELAGVWTETVAPGRHKDYERRDLVSVRHGRNARRFHVRIERQFPDHESDRRWSGVGYILAIDEAHSNQGGRATAKMSQALSEPKMSEAVRPCRNMALVMRMRRLRISLTGS